MKFLKNNRRIGLFIFKFLVIAVIVTTFFFGLSQLKKQRDKIPFLKHFNYEVLFFIENIESIGIVAGLLALILNVPEQQKKSHYEAWQVINSAQNQRGSGGRIQALEDLVRDGVSLDGVVVSDAYLTKINLQKAKLDNADFSNANLVGANFRGANLIGANFSSTNLNGVCFSNARFSNANLSGANCSYAIFNDAYLFCTNLSGANVTHTNLSNAYLNNAYFSGANLYCANLSGAYLSRSNFNKADLSGAKFWDKNLQLEARNITPKQIKEAKNWEKAVYSRIP